MPIITIDGSQPEHFGQLVAIMVYPEKTSEKRRSECVEYYSLGKEHWPKGKLEPTSNRESMLLRLAAHEICGDQRDMFGSLAGMVLHVLRQLADHHADHEPSVSKATYVVEKMCREMHGKTKWGSKLPRDADSIRKKAWTPFRGVASLWHAFYLTAGEFGQNNVPLNLPYMLAMADKLSKSVAKIKIKNTGSIFDGCDLWRISPSLDLPIVALPKTTSLDAEYLEGYRGRGRHRKST